MTHPPGLRAIVNEINKKLGDGSILFGSEMPQGPRPRATSGSVSLDVALGGGWPLNQFVEIVGDESSGKTALALKTIAANQARDKNWVAAWFDAENSYDPIWASKLGVDNDRIVVMGESGMETVYDAATKFLKSREVDAVVIDSYPALVPEREDEATMFELQVGLGALITGKFFRKQGSATKRSLITPERPVLAIIINQWREKIGVMYGDNRTTPGGRAKNYSFFVRVEVKRDDWIEEGSERIGQVMKFRCFKNKSAVPQRTATVDFYFDTGKDNEAGSFDTGKDIVSSAVMLDVVTTTGGGIYRYGDQKWKGRAALTEAVLGDEALQEAITADVLRLVRHDVEPPAPAAKKVVRRPRAQ